MIIPDVNVLVYAYRIESPRHEAYRAWLTAATHGEDAVALTDLTASGFVRVVTHRRIFSPPAPVSQAITFVTTLLAAPRVGWLEESGSVWEHLGRLARSDPAITGNRVPDAYLAASALAHGARLATADRGFARYPGLRFFDPCPG